jgi:tetratricopeptide (TPR) repeat protein
MNEIFSGEIKNTRFILTIVAVGLFALFGIVIILLIGVMLFVAPEKTTIPEGLMGLLTTLMGAIIAIVSVAYNSHFKAREDDAAAKTDAARVAAARAPVEDYCNKGIALGKQGRYDESIQAFDEAIKRDPGNAIVWHNKGIALTKQGKYIGAVPAYDEAIKLDSKNEAAVQSRAIALKASENTPEGLAARDKAKGLEFIG